MFGNREKLEARKMPENAAESPPSSAVHALLGVLCSTRLIVQKQDSTAYLTLFLHTTQCVTMTQITQPMEATNHQKLNIAENKLKPTVDLSIHQESCNR